jgi:OOP family OmpA-OmpF porin
VWTFLSVRERQRWQAYIEQLRAAPGIVVIDSGRSNGKYFVTGLRDPLAEDPDVILWGAGITPDEIDRRWELYQASDPTFVLARARQVLRPPPGVSLAMQEQVLRATGAAPSGWIRENERLALIIPGVRQFDHSAVIAADVQALKQELEATAFHFPRGSARVRDGERAPRVVAVLQQLNDIARALDQRPHIEVVGHTDSDGPPSSNLPLSFERAEAVMALLRAGELTALTLAAGGVGSAEPVADGDTEADKQRNRRVSFRVTVAQSGRPEDRQK